MISMAAPGSLGANTPLAGYHRQFVTYNEVGTPLNIPLYES